MHTKIDTLSSFDDLVAFMGGEAVRHTLELRLEVHPGAVGVVVFECLDMCSSNFGRRTSLIVGEGCTYGSLDEVRDRPLGDVPSRFQYPVAYWEVTR